MGFEYHIKINVGEPHVFVARGGQNVKRRLPSQLERFRELFINPNHPQIAPPHYVEGVYDTYFYSDQELTPKEIQRHIPGLDILLFTPSHPAEV